MSKRTAYRQFVESALREHQLGSFEVLFSNGDDRDQMSNVFASCGCLVTDLRNEFSIRVMLPKADVDSIEEAALAVA